MARSRKILALLFELRAENGNVGQIIAWLDDWGLSPHLVPAHPDQSLLDCTAGDIVMFKRRIRLDVVRIKPWRTNCCTDETQVDWIVSGRDWERQTP